MNSEEAYHEFENMLQTKIAEVATKLVFSYEPTVTPGVFLGKIASSTTPARAIIKTDVRPEGLRLHFPVEWGDELSEWMGAPPPDAYRLKSNWVNQPSIGIGTADFDPYLLKLSEKVIAMLDKKLGTSTK